MTHRGHVKKVQAAFYHAAGPSTAVLSGWLCEAGVRMDMVHLLWGSNKAGSGKALLTPLHNLHCEECRGGLRAGRSEDHVV